jgi:Major Facilitator Superfamily
MFFIEGVITVCVGFLAIWFLPHTPKEAKFLSEAERSVALHRMKLDAHGPTTQEDVGQEHFQWRWVRKALLSPNTIFCSLAWFWLLVPLYVRIPSLLETPCCRAIHYSFQRSSMHSATLQPPAQLFTVSPNISAFFLVLVSAGFSDRLRARGPFMLAGCLLAIIGYAMLIAANRPAVNYGGNFFVAAGVFPGKHYSSTLPDVFLMNHPRLPNGNGLASNNLAPHYVRLRV